MRDLYANVLARAAVTPSSVGGLSAFYDWLLAWPDPCLFGAAFPRPQRLDGIGSRRKARLISFDGISGSGKDTQIRLLEKRLAPGIACRILATKRLNPFREVLMEYWKAHPGKRDRTVETALLWAGRRYFTEVFLRPALAEDTGVVLQARTFLSDVVFMSGDAGRLAELLELCGDDPRPDLGLVLTVSPGVAASRVRQRTRESGRAVQPQERLSVLRRTASLYDTLLANPPGAFVRIEASRPEEAVHDDIWRAVAGL